MSKQLPLYDNLYKYINNENLVNTDLDENQKNLFVKSIKKIDKNGMELLYILIRYYQVNHDDLHSLELPYNSKKQKLGYKFDLDLLPNTLKQILYRFVELNLNN
tara:strand:- start:289 stop:600 length:312 start_codon:yes stop_codon:yes gene_type:complete